MSSKVQKAKKNTRSSRLVSDNTPLVEPLRGTIIFILLLIFSSFFGGAFRVLLSSGQIDAVIRQRVQVAAIGYKVDFSNAEFLLADGIYPKFGFRIENIQITPLESCVGNWGAKSGSVYFPLDIISTIRKNIKFTEILVSSLILKQFTENCDASQISKITESVSIETSENVKLKISNPNVNQIKKHAKNIQSLLLNNLNPNLKSAKDKFNSVQVLDLSLVTEDSNRVDRFSDIQLKVKTKKVADVTVNELAVTAKYLNPGKQIGLDLQPLNINLKLNSEKLNLLASTQQQEGKVTLSASFDNNFETFDSELTISSVPLRQSGVSSWVNCKLSLNTKIDDLEAAKYILRDCRLFGDLGELKLANAEINFSNPVYQTEIKLDLTNVSLEKLLKLFSRRPLTELLPEHGTINGEVLIGKNANVEIKGIVSNVHLLFVEGLKREYLKFISANFFANYKNGRWSAKVLDMQIEDGKLIGEFSINANSKFTEGLFQFNFPEIKFSKKVYSLYRITEKSEFEFYGRGLINDKEVGQWTGVIGVNNIVGETFKVSNLKLKGNYHKDDGYKGNATVNSWELLEGNFLYSEANAILLRGQNLEKKSIKLQLITGGLNVTDREIELKNMSARSEADLTSLLLNGVYSTDKRTGSGKMTVSHGVIRDSLWNLELIKGQLNIWPTQDLVRKFEKLIEAEIPEKDEEFKQYSLQWKQQLIKEPSPLKKLRALKK